MVRSQILNFIKLYWEKLYEHVWGHLYVHCHLMVESLKTPNLWWEIRCTCRLLRYDDVTKQLRQLRTMTPCWHSGWNQCGQSLSIHCNNRIHDNWPRMARPEAKALQTFKKREKKWSEISPCNHLLSAMPGVAYDWFCLFVLFCLWFFFVLLKKGSLKGGDLHNMLYIHCINTIHIFTWQFDHKCPHITWHNWILLVILKKPSSEISDILQAPTSEGIIHLRKKKSKIWCSYVV